MKHLKIAFRFLTRLPLGAEEAYGMGDFGSSTGFYPLVGLIAGLLLYLLRFLSAQDPGRGHHAIWSFGLLLFWVWFCGSLHLDGLADTADALASRKEGSDFAAVLHDSRVGAFGALAMALALTAKFVWLGSLPLQGAWFMALPFVVSRLHSALACQIRPYSGRPGSLSSMFIQEAGPGDARAAWAWSGVSFAILAGMGLGLKLADASDVLKALGVCGAGLGLGRQFLKLPMSRLGGISGDLIGWSQVLVEIAVAFGLVLALLP